MEDRGRILDAFVAWSLCFLAGSSVLVGQSSGSIQGRVSAEAGGAILGAFVTAYRQGTPPASGGAAAAADGNFRIANLPAGAYALCVQAPGYLDPCRWSLKQIVVTLTAGQASAGNLLRIKKGSTLRVRLNDPGRVLQAQGRAAPRHVLIGVLRQGFFHPASVASKDASGANYELTIPPDTPLTLSVFSKQARLADAKGSPIAATGLSQSFQQKSGDATPPVFTFTVVGPA